MDWFSWLSRTNLDPCLIYQYGLVLSRNELQHEDISYFNHEFLLSMGISVAKHRLEILKLVAKDTSHHKIRFYKLISSIKKCVHRYVFNHNSSLKPLPLPEPVPAPSPVPARFKQQPWKDLPVIRNRRQVKSGPLVVPRNNNLTVNHRRLKLSGPLDGRVPERLMFDDDRKLKLSGPLDGNSHDRLVFSYRSPKLYAGSDINQRLMVAPLKSPARVAKPLDCNNMEKSRKSNGDDDLDDKLLWAALFQDMNPT